jgi:ubiquinone/menaquinone biosynthesis C-methylase UbiE
VSESRWGAYLTERQRLNLEHALHRVTPGTALEVGCEGGRWSEFIERRGWDVVCTDIDADSLRRCQQRLPQASCILVSADDETLPIEEKAVRLLLVYEVESVIESSWFLAEARRVLEPGGLLVCSYLNPTSARGAAYRFLARVSSRTRDGVARFQHYYRGPTYRAFRRALREHGFEPVREEGVCWFPFTRASNSIAVPWAVRAERALGLYRLPTVSPWILMVAIRRDG